MWIARIAGIRSSTWAATRASTGPKIATTVPSSAKSSWVTSTVCRAVNALLVDVIKYKYDNAKHQQTFDSTSSVVWRRVTFVLRVLISVLVRLLPLICILVVIILLVVLFLLVRFALLCQLEVVLQPARTAEDEGVVCVVVAFAGHV